MTGRRNGREIGAWCLGAATMLVTVTSCGAGAAGNAAGNVEAMPASSAAAPASATTAGDRRSSRRAVVVGIRDYSASRLDAPAGSAPAAPGRSWPDLLGTVNDARAIRDVLTARYDFAAGDVRVLLDQEATRARVLAAIEEHLVAAARAGDQLLFYWAGHGSRVRNSRSEEPDGMDESLVPADSRLGAPDIRDKELRRLFDRALDRGARVTVILDSCHSSSGVRGERPVRGIRPDSRDAADETGSGPPLETRGGVVFAAAQDFQPAEETWDSEWRLHHGAFTLALLRAIRAGPDGESAESVFRRTRAWLQGPGGANQEPSIAGRPGDLAAPLLGRGGAQKERSPQAAVETVDASGEVVLQTGWIHGLEVGSELVGVGEPADREPLRLRVTSLDGLTRSRAELAGPPARRRAAAGPRPGDLFTLAGWTVPPGPPLQVWIPRAAEAARSGAVELAQAAQGVGVAVASDPTAGAPPTHLLSWRDGGWRLTAGDRVESLASTRPAAALARLRDSGPPPRLFVEMPVSWELADAIEAAIRHSKVEIAGDPAQADYVLTGRWQQGALELAWIRPGVTAADEARSSLPLRSRWRRFEGPAADQPGLARALAADAAGLARVRAWLWLAELSPPAGDFPYRLALRAAQPDSEVRTAGDLVAGERYGLELTAQEPIPAPPLAQRYVYAFLVDSAGGCQLLHPHPDLGNVENRFPLDPLPPYPTVIPLAGGRPLLEVSAPFGVDNYYLLATVEPIANPRVLECAAVRGSGPGSALEELLADAGEPTRGANKPRSVPETWSLERLSFHAREAPVPVAPPAARGATGAPGGAAANASAAGEGAPAAVEDLLHRGRSALAAERPDEARVAFEAALAALAERRDPAAEAETWKDLATALYRLELYAESERAQRRGLALAREVGDRRLEARLTNALGLSLQALGRGEEAETLFGRGLELARRAGEGEVEVYALANLAIAALGHGDLDRAEALFDRSLNGAHRLDRLDLQARLDLGKAQVASSRQDGAGAILHGRRAADAFRRTGERDGIVTALSFLGAAWLEAGLPSRALRTLEEALVPAGELGGERQLLILQTMHLAARLQSSEKPTREHLERQVDIGEQLLALAEDRDPGLARSTAAQLGEARELLASVDDLDFESGSSVIDGDPPAARRQREEIVALRELAWSRAEGGDVAGALELARDSLELARSAADHSEESRSLGTVGALYLIVGQPERAECFFVEARELAERLSDDQRLAWSDLSIANARLLKGDVRSAAAGFDRGVLAARRLDDPELEALAHSGRGIVAVTDGDQRRAIESWMRELVLLGSLKPPAAAPDARELLESLVGSHRLPRPDHEPTPQPRQADPALAGLLQGHLTLDRRAAALEAEWARTQALRQALVLRNLAWTHASLGQLREARQRIEEMLAIVASLGAAEDRAGADATLGYVHYQAARSATSEPARLAALADAEASLRRAVAELRELRSKLGRAEGFKISSHDLHSVPFELLQRVLVERGAIEEALEIAELARGRAIAEASAWWRESTPSETAQLRAPGVDEMRSLARSTGTTIVVYSMLFDPAALLLAGRVGGEQAELEETLLIWVVTPRGEVDLQQVHLAALRRQPQPTSLARLVTASRDALGLGLRGSRTLPAGGARPAEQVLADLARLLIDPIAHHLTPAAEPARLVIVPHGFLALVPFAALPVADGEPLVARIALATVPSVGVLAALPSAPPGAWAKEDALVVGDPALPAAHAHLRPLDGARREAVAIAELLATRPLIGTAATKGAVASSMPTKRLVHLATHGLLEVPDPTPRTPCAIGDGSLRDPRELPGALVLASDDGDGLLTAGELSDMRLEAELVVLSACDTGGGRVTGDGVIGLARSFLVAGADAVVVSLWQVEDASTALLMERFYSHLSAGGNAAEALRRAMLETRRDHPHPRWWSGFVLVGRP